MGEAQAGSARQAKAFVDLGVSANQSAEDALPQVAAALLHITDTGERARLEVALFGKAGEEINAMLPDLATGVDALTAKYDALGRMLDPKVTQAAHDANIKLEQASQQLKTTFAPYVVAATQDLALFVAQVEHLIAQPMSFLEPLKFPMPAQPKTPDNAPQVTPKAPSEQEEIAALGMMDAQAERALRSHQRTHDGAEGAGRCDTKESLLQPRLFADIKKQLEAVNKQERRSSRTIPDGRRNSTSN